MSAPSEGLQEVFRRGGSYGFARASDGRVERAVHVLHSGPRPATDSTHEDEPNRTEETMRRPFVFAEGVGAGISAVLIVGAVLWMTRTRMVAAAARRIHRAARSGRSPFTNALPANYLDVCREAGL